MNRTYYYIDAENVGAAWKSYIPNMKPGDSVAVFYTKNQTGQNITGTELTQTLSKQLLQKHISVEYHLTASGHNALDYQLSSMLGQRLFLNPDSEHIIISQDKGYDAVVRHWQNNNLNIRRIDTVNILMENPSTAEEIRKQWNYFESICISTNIPWKYITGVVDILIDCQNHIPTSRLRVIRRDLMKAYGTNAGNKLYTKLKPELHRMRQNNIL